MISELDRLEIPYMLTGSLVSSLQGEPRATHDIDLVVELPVRIESDLVEAFSDPHYYISRAAIRRAVEEKSMFNLIDSSSGDKVDFWILTDDEFDQSRFGRRIAEKLFGMCVFVSTPEDTILMKLNWAHQSGGSEKQFRDALRVYELQHGKLDRQYLERWAERLSIGDLWDRLLKDADPL